MNEWIKVSKKLPEESKTVMPCLFKHYNPYETDDISIVYCSYEDGRFWKKFCDLTKWIIAWKPSEVSQ